MEIIGEAKASVGAGSQGMTDQAVAWGDLFGL